MFSGVSKYILWVSTKDEERRVNSNMAFLSLPARYHKIPSSEGLDLKDEQDEVRPWSSSIWGGAVN
jgi:hypothetical protein